MLQLNDLLPSSQWESDWTFYGRDHEGLPDDAEYVVFEYYCENTRCDCHSLVAQIMKLGSDGEPIMKSLAVIDYDWSTEGSKCYPALAESSPRTATAEYILEVYKKFTHHPDYIARIKNHYARVRKLAIEKANKQNLSTKNNGKKIGRNDPCICGSGKKFKKCCNNKISVTGRSS